MRTIDADELKKMFPDKDEGAWTYNITAKAYIDAAPTVDQWHYPSRGELPKEGETVLLLTNEGDPHLGHFANEYYWETDSFVCHSDCIKCWQSIVPPQEEA